MTNNQNGTVSIESNGRTYTGNLYEDFLTFKRWKKLGKSVKKGEKSCYKSLTFIPVEDKTNDKIKKIPKIYHLFHFSQVA